MQQVETKTDSSLTAELIATLRSHPYRDPMFHAMREGKISRDGVKRWVLQAMLVVRDFTRFISAIHANCPYRDAQQLLAENLWEEHGHGDPSRDHLSLAIRMARSLGATDLEIKEAKPLPETYDYIDHCLNVTRNGSFVEGMTAIGIGMEYSIPVFFGALAESLERHYGITRHDLAYLLVHVTEDAEHAARALTLIEKYADTEQIRERSRRALREMLTAKQRFAEALFVHCSGQQV